MTEKNSLLAYIEAFSEAFEKLRSLPAISDAQKQAAFTEAFSKLSPQDQAEQAFLHWYYGNQRDRQLNKSINQASATRKTLANGRAAGTKSRTTKADEKKEQVRKFVRALYERPQDQLGPSGCTVFDLTLPQLVRFTKERIDTHGYKDTTLEKIVGGVVAEQKRARRERAAVLWPD